MKLSWIPFFGKRIPRRTVLELDLEPGVVEHLPDDATARMLHRRALVLRDIVDALERGAGDGRVLGLIVRVGPASLGTARIEELRDAVAAFRSTGKPAVAFSESFGEFGPGTGGYYLATAFDEIWLQPSGAVGLTGVVAATPFARRLLDRLGLEPRLERRHEYKTLVNLFTEDGYTEPHREATEAVVESIFGRIVDGVSGARGIPAESVRALVDRAPLPAAEALDSGLVDRLGYRDQAYAALEAGVDGDVEFLDAAEYLDRAGRPHRKGRRSIAVIYGVGAVQRGPSRFHPLFGTTAGSDTLVSAFDDAIADPAVEAIVFRVDSPGGSYVASDAVRRQVVRARQAGKPVVASMGNAAASGGYFICMAADAIVAHPSTLTGSIGVLAGKMLTEKLWGKAGVDWDEVHAGEHATMWTGVRDYSPDQKARLEAWLDRVYADFTSKAAADRGLSSEQVDEVARGRVWTGADAHRLGLVDTLGGFPRAVRLARREAGLPRDARVRVRVFPQKRSLLQMLRGESAGGSRAGTRSGPAATLHGLERSIGTAVRMAVRGAPRALESGVDDAFDLPLP